MRHLGPSLSSLSFAFSSCSSLERIVVDASWALPKGYMGAQTFYNRAVTGRRFPPATRGTR